MADTKQSALILGDQLAQDLTQAVINVLGKTFSLDVHAGRCEVGNGSAKLNGDVSGIVGIVQDRLEGTLTVCFSYETVQRLIPMLLGSDGEETQDVALDAVGELTNMIFGQIKTDLNERGHKIRFGLPTVVRGPGHFISHLHLGQYLVIPFELGEDNFQVFVAIHNQPVW
jgi:chemotaxis protein CheX